MNFKIHENLQQPSAADAPRVGDQTKGQANVSKADDRELAPEDTTKILGRKIQRRADLRFANGVGLALALPAFIGLAVYVAAEFLKGELKIRPKASAAGTMVAARGLVAGQKFVE